MQVAQEGPADLTAKDEKANSMYMLSVTAISGLHRSARFALLSDLLASLATRCGLYFHRVHRRRCGDGFFHS